MSGLHIQEITYSQHFKKWMHSKPYISKLVPTWDKKNALVAEEYWETHVPAPA